MPNQPPVRLRLHKNNRLTRRQGEVLLKALLTVDENKLFEPQEKKSFYAAFDKLTEAWREAVERENERAQNKPRKPPSPKPITGSVMYPLSAKKKNRVTKIVYLGNSSGG